MEIRDAVALTRATSSATFEITARHGVPSLDAEDLRGTGVVDFHADRVRLTDRMVTPRMRSRANRSGPIRVISAPIFAVSDRIVGREIFYEGSARWRLRRGRWIGPEGGAASAKNTWHPLFLLDMLEADIRPLPAGIRESFAGIDVTRIEMSLESAETPPAVWESWLLSQTEPEGAVGRRPFRPPRAVLWVADDGILHGFSYEAVVGAEDDASLWHSARLWAFGTSTDELDRLGGQLAT